MRPVAVLPRARAASLRLLLLVPLTGLAVLSTVLTPLLSPAQAAGPDTGSGSAAALPFSLPSTATLRGSSRKAFAHYVPSLPVSLDNGAPGSDYWATQYLDPNGEGGKHAAYGGYSRDRPLGRDAIADSAWRLRDMENEVRQAVSVGLDGFSVTVYYLASAGDRQWDNINLLMQAAANVDPGFKIMLQPDMSGNIGSTDPGTLALYMSRLASNSSAYRLPDGRLVFSPFYAERQNAGWWSTFLSVMNNNYGIPVAFLPLFLDEQSNEDAFASISYGMSNWGSRSPAGNDPTTTYATSPAGRIARVHALGKKWMQPISVQDERPRESLYDEAQNTTNLRNTWTIAMNNNADLVQLNTWNDYPEGSPMAPSASHGWSFLDINAYYLAWWKTGVRPAVVRDTVYVSHRKHPLSASPTFPQTLFMRPRAGSSPGRDTVEALTFLPSPGTVTIRVGGASSSCAAPAGPGVCTVPLGTGTVSASVVRDGVTTTSVTSPFGVTTSPLVQDFAYTAVSSGRTGTRSVPTTSTTSTSPGDVQLTVTPVADTYANEGAPNTTFGTSASLASQGGSPGAAAYLRFLVPAAPAGKVLVASSLRVRTNSLDSAGSRYPHQVLLASDSWSEDTMTWNNRAPGISGIGTIGSDTVPNSVYTVPVDLGVMRGQLGRSTTLALASSYTDSLWLWSSNHPDASYRPQLVLTYR